MTQERLDEIKGDMDDWQKNDAYGDWTDENLIQYITKKDFDDLIAAVTPGAEDNALEKLRCEVSELSAALTGLKNRLGMS